MDKENKLILYKDEEGRVNVNVRFADEDVWLSQQQLAEIYCTMKQNVSQHIDNILADGELEENRTVKYFLTVRQEGKETVFFECAFAQTHSKKQYRQLESNSF